MPSGAEGDSSGGTYDFTDEGWTNSQGSGADGYSNNDWYNPYSSSSSGGGSGDGTSSGGDSSSGGETPPPPPPPSTDPAETFTLESGYIVGVHTGFVLPEADRVDSAITTTGSDPIDESSTVDGVTFTSVGTTNWTLTATSMLLANGWSYDETYTSISTYAVTGSDGATSDFSTVYSYTFHAVDDGSDLTFSYAATVGDSATGTYTENWNPTQPGTTSTGSLTWTWGRISQEQISLGFQKDLTSNLGSLTSQYGATESSWITGSGTYSYSVPGGQVAGAFSAMGGDKSSLSSLVSEAQGSDGTWATVSGTASGSGASKFTSQYQGSGTYASKDETSTVSGTITQSGTDESADAYDFSATLDANDDWQTTGGSTTFSGKGTSSYSYSGKGTFLDDTVAGTVSLGSIDESGGFTDGYSYSGGAQFGPAVVAPDPNDPNAQLPPVMTAPTISFDGSGDSQTVVDEGQDITLTIERPAGTTGDIVITLTSSDTTEMVGPTTVTILDGQNSVTVTLHVVNDGIDDGTQVVTLTITTGNDSATLTAFVRDDEGTGTTGTPPTNSQGVWTGTMSGTGSYSETQSLTILGTYVTTDSAGSISGTMSNVYGSTDSGQYQYSAELNEQEEWQLSAGSASGSGSSHFIATYSGSGAYSYNIEDQSSSGGEPTTTEPPTRTGTVSGVRQESGLFRDVVDYEVAQQVGLNGDWDPATGDSAEVIQSTDSFSYSGSGTYTDTAAVEGGVVTGKITESGGYLDSVNILQKSSLSAQEMWDVTYGDISISGSSDSDYSYSGSGSYTRTTTDSTMSGVYTESGSTYYNSTYQASGLQVIPPPPTNTGEPETSTTETTTEPAIEWNWTSGSGTEDYGYATSVSYSGSGTFSTTTANGSTQGKLSEVFSMSITNDTETTQSLDQDGDWLDVSGDSKSTTHFVTAFAMTGTGHVDIFSTVVTISLDSILNIASSEKFDESTEESLLSDGTWTLAVWQRFYAVPLTVEDAVEMLMRVGNLMGVLHTNPALLKGT